MKSKTRIFKTSSSLLGMGLFLGFFVSSPTLAMEYAQHELGFVGQQNDIELLNNGSEKFDEFGVQYLYSNLYTAKEGYVYRSNAEWIEGDKNNVDSSKYDIGLTSGYRMDLDGGVYFDWLTGLGYSNWELSDNDVSVKSDSIYLRYGAALQIDANSDNIVRVEAGSRYNINGNMDISTTDEKIESSTKKRNSFYTEISWMTYDTGIPARLSLFYNKDRYVSDIENNNVSQNGDIIGLSINLML